MYIVTNKVEDEEFESEVKTGNGSSFSRHFDEKPQKMAKNLGVFPHICEVAPLTHFNIWKNCQQNLNYTGVVHKPRKFHGASPPLAGDIGPQTWHGCEMTKIGLRTV